MDEQNNLQPNNGEPQKTAVAPQKTAVAPQKTAVAPQKTAVAPQKTAVAPQKTAVAPQKTAVAPPAAQKTAVAPQKTAVAGAADIPVGPKPISVAHEPGETIQAGGKTYTVEKVMGQGTEGSIYQVTDGKHRYALKCCHPGFQTNTAVMPALQKLKGKGYISDIVDYANDFELLEFVPEGSAAGAGVKGNAQAILAIAVKTAMALSEMHKVGIIHKDIKPANILIKDRNTWDSVLCDFGIADTLKADGKVVTPQVRTPIYAAPEVYGNDNTIMQEGITYCELTAKADFYSLGMTILSLWMGEGAFRSKEAELAIDKNKGRIDVPADMPDPLAKICRGLLVKSVEKRWDLDKIERTLKGEDVPVEELIEIEPLNIPFNKSKQMVANTPEELAQCMADEPDLAIRYLYTGQIEKWLKTYPELVIQIQEIVEKRYPKDQEKGRLATIYLLNPAYPYFLSGISRDSGEEVEKAAITLKDVSDFCNIAIPDETTASNLSSDFFLEWCRVRNEAIVKDFPKSERYTCDSDVYRLRVQMIDPLSDINLRNDPSHPDYAMTGEAIGRFLNQVYNIFWNKCEGDITSLEDIWSRPEFAPLNRQIPINAVMCVTNSFMLWDDSHYLIRFFNTKGTRFRDQIRWYISATEKDNVFEQKAGPKDDNFFMQMSWMRVIKGYGATPEYELVDQGKRVSTLKELFHESKKTLQKEYDDRGLQGFLAVNRMEDPMADLKPRFAYEELLRQYVEDLAKVDEQMEPVQRFRQATREAAKLLSEGKSKIRSLTARSLTQRVLTIALAVVPAVLLLLMLLFSIIEQPVVDLSGTDMQNTFMWVGVVIAAIIYIFMLAGGAGGGCAGCFGALIVGAILAVILYFLTKFLGQYILYFYALIVLAVLVFFSLKTVFSRSHYATEARRFNKPGFDEKVLEPLYHAFNDDEVFESSLEGAFNDEDIQNWKADLKVRRIYMFLFIGAVWFLLLFGAFVPKSERFQRLLAPVERTVAPVFKAVGSAFDRIFPSSGEEEVLDLPTFSFESLEPGTKGDAVKELQQFLKDHGYKIPVVDGDYGKRTIRAVAAYQQDKELPATGTADAETVKVMTAQLQEEYRQQLEQQKQLEEQSQEQQEEQPQEQ